MERIAILGNAGAGKSTLSRQLAARLDLPLIEVDRFMWQDGWAPAPDDAYARAHADAIAGASWVIDGMGRMKSLVARMDRATCIVFVDLPFVVLEKRIRARQAAWAAGTLAHAPGAQAEPPDTDELLRVVSEIDRDFMPRLRDLVRGSRKPVHWFSDPLPTTEMLERILGEPAEV